MTRNTLTDLNNHLFAQLEKLSDEDLSQEEITKEVSRAKAINDLAKNIIQNAKTALEGAKFSYQQIPANQEGTLPTQFRIKQSEDTVS